MNHQILADHSPAVCGKRKVSLNELCDLGGERQTYQRSPTPLLFGFSSDWAWIGCFAADLRTRSRGTVENKLRMMMMMRSMLLGMLLLIGADLTRADDSPAPVDDPLKYAGPTREGDQLWMVNTRAIQKPTIKDPGMAIRKANDWSQWEDADLEALVAPTPRDMQTLIYVHGYDFNAQKAERVGWAMYHVLREQLPGQQHFRLIVWSWPSTALKFRFVRDVREKARRTNVEAVFLAWLLSRVDADVIIGSALGCRAVTGSLHLLAGDARTLNTVIAADHRQEKLRVVLISPAIHNDWLLPGEYHGKALLQVQRILLLNNTGDPTLAHYAAISLKGKPVALGFSGLLAADKLGDKANRLEQVDVLPYIGEEHGVENYLRSSPIVRRIAEFAFVSADPQ